MKRFVTYLYLYDGRIKGNNAGFIKVEINGEKSAFLVQIKNLGKYSGKGRVYLIYEAELGVSIRTIQYDIQALSPQYPIYTKPGENGGLFIREDYNPHINSLTPMELENLREMYEQTEGVHKKVLLQIIRKYGPDKLKL